MWQLKFEYAHKDCLYSSHVKHLRLIMQGYPLNHFIEKGKLRLTGLQILQGSAVNVQKYIAALKKTKNIHKIERISENVFFYETILSSNLEYYQSFYHPQIFYLSPIRHQHGKELFEIASWDRKLLEKIMNNVKQNKNTLHFKLLLLRRMPVKKVFIPQILPKLTDKQRVILSLAKERGYWNYPKKTNLNQLAGELKLSKSTVHEILKRGEARLLDFFI